ncbi:LapA family protein [endosymbiont GvMRE of Glomus versiforme]|uniref:LapA family protein n=1 Tax=endosymbiont GvMRE of Glomus versiforme TaxID=2039283 RepID=UPI000EED1E66|nr:LapA family protein [endosymbiont GvMRE of Glomus versiforme]RHZ36711.1 hypothetical protein GvMRE_I2g317 [endosymbiont GvMRE of Glomus versiforme]
MNNKEIINYIKIREAWKDTLRAKSSALSSVWSGLFRLGSFLAYWAIDKIFLKKEIEEMYQRNPNFKYVFYLALAFGIWGVIDALLGFYNYFQASQQAEQLKKQVEKLESELEK